MQENFLSRKFSCILRIPRISRRLSVSETVGDLHALIGEGFKRPVGEG